MSTHREDCRHHEYTDDGVPVMPCEKCDGYGEITCTCRCGNTHVDDDCSECDGAGEVECACQGGEAEDSV